MFKLIALQLTLTALSIAQTKPYIVSTVMGSSPIISSISEESAAARTQIFDAERARLTGDGSGNLYFIDSGRIRKLSVDGRVTSIAGTVFYGWTENGRPAKDSPINPAGGYGAEVFPLAAGTDGSLYFLDLSLVGSQYVLRRIDASGILQTITSLPGTLDLRSIAIDAASSIYLSDRASGRVHKVDAQGNVSLFAGTGSSGYSGDGGPASQADLGFPEAVAADKNGNVYIAAAGFFGFPYVDQLRIRKVDPSGRITTFAGVAGSTDETCKTGTAAQLSIPHPGALATGPDGSVFLAGRLSGVCRITSDGQSTGYFVPFGGGSATSLAADTGGRLSFITGRSIQMVRAGGQAPVETLGYRSDPDRAFALFSQQGSPIILARASGDLLVANSGGVIRVRNGRVDQLNTTFNGINIAAITEDGDGNLFVLDRSGQISRLAATGEFRPVVDTRLNIGSGGTGLVRDARGNFYVSHSFVHQVFRVTPDGQTTPFAGVTNVDGIGYSGDGGPAIQAKLTSPGGLALDRSGNLYIADLGNHTVRKVGLNGVISTVAGSQRQDPEPFTGDGGPATEAVLRRANSVAIDANGVIYIGDGNRIRAVTPEGIISTIAGRASRWFIAAADDEGVPALDALAGGESISVAPNGDVFFFQSGRLRRISPLRGALPVIAASSFLNAASFRPQPLAPGEFVTLFAQDLADQPTAAVDGPVFQLAGISVLVADNSGEDMPALLSYAAPSQVSFVMPAGLAPGPGRITIIVPDGRRLVTKLTLAPIAPGIFIMGTFGSGVPAAQAVRTRPDNTQTTQTLFKCGTACTGVPVDFGQLADRISLVLYGTGFRNRSSLDAVSVTLGDVRLTPVFAGAQGQYPGLDQIVVELPGTLRGKGPVEGIVAVDGVAANRFSLSF